MLVERLLRAGVRHESVLLVVNRWSRSCELSVRAVERAVGLPLAAVLRDDHGWGEAFAGRSAAPIRRAPRRRPRPDPAAGAAGGVSVDPADLVTRYRERVREQLASRPLHGDLRLAAEAATLELVRADGLPLASSELEHLVSAIADEAAGVGPLEPLMRDPT